MKKNSSYEAMDIDDGPGEVSDPDEETLLQEELRQIEEEEARKKNASLEGKFQKLIFNICNFSLMLLLMHKWKSAQLKILHQFFSNFFYTTILYHKTVFK